MTRWSCPRPTPPRWPSGIIRLIEDPALAARLAAGARVTGARYDIGVFVRKMERLYELLHESSRRTRRQGILSADLTFLHEGGAP